MLPKIATVSPNCEQLILKTEAGQQLAKDARVRKAMREAITVLGDSQNRRSGHNNAHDLRTCYSTEILPRFSDDFGTMTVTFGFSLVQCVLLYVCCTDGIVYLMWDCMLLFAHG